MSKSFSVLFPASWRGVPFAVERGERRLGRKLAVHDYPYRDGVYVEDLGKKGRRISLYGFLISHSLVYGGGDVQLQLTLLEATADLEGAGLLMHPTRGPMLLELEDLVVAERWDEGQYFELQFSFIEGGQQLFPAVLSSVTGLVSGAVSGLLGAVAGSFAGTLAPLVTAASTRVLSAVAGAWSGKVLAVAGDATCVFGMVSQLGGANYGRYASGGNAGFQQALASPYTAATSIDDLVSLASVQRQAVSTAGAGVSGAIGGLGVTAQPADVAVAAQGLVTALQACPANPGDGVRLLTALAAYGPGTGASASPVGAAFGALMRRTAVAGAATAAATYAPSSADDANAVRSQVLTSIDAEISTAGATYDDAAFSALRNLRKAVYTDLGQRGASLPRLATVDAAGAVPAIVAAQRLYLDPTRRDELVTEADPIHPLFMPLQYQALSS